MAEGIIVLSIYLAVAKTPSRARMAVFWWLASAAIVGAAVSAIYMGTITDTPLASSITD